MGSMAYSEDPDEMLCLLQTKSISKKGKYFGNFNCNPSIHTMDHTIDHPDVFVSNLMENSIGLKKANKILL